MTDDEKADVQLARDVLTETLHGPVPIATVARLAQAVLRLDEARRWRPLTSYPETWPEDGQLVAVYNIGDGAADADTFQRDALYHKWYTHWLPLPPPSEEVGGG